MKRIVLMMSLAGAVLLASCVQQMPGPEVGRTATVSVGVGLSEMSTRAYADGTTAKQLQYAVYEVKDNNLVKIENTGTTEIDGDPYEGTKEMNNLKTQLSFSLLTGHKYGIVFWADSYGGATGAPYTVEFAEEGATMKVDYLKVKANDEKLDAFYAYEEITVNGDGSVSVQLTRPFAQINIGTNDFEKAKVLGGAPDQSYVTVPTYTTLDLKTGAVSGKATTPATYNAIPGQAEGVDPEKYPVEGYDYLAMAYVLVDNENESETIDVAFGWAASPATSGKERTVGSVPVRPNYRTNIYGSILTGSLDLDVEIVPGVGGEDNVMLTWDGETYTQPAYDAEKQTWTVKGADELAWLASQENKDFAGETIELQSDLDLAGKKFPAFAKGALRSGNGIAGGSTSFKGEFDGNGKTIKGFKAEAVKNGSEAAGFFSNIADGAVVKNVTFENVEIVSDIAEQAGIVGIVSGGATVENVKVMGGTIKSKEAAGGIVGRILKSGTVKDCENHANVSTTAHNVGGIVGAAYYNNEGMTITDCDNYGNVSGNYAAGGIVGLNTGDVSNCNNYGKSVVCNNASVGGIVGEQHASGSITGCTNYADITGGDGGTTGTYGAGGIVGWVRYDGNTANYPNLEPITVSDCTNEGKHITGVTGVGGIVGMWYCDGLCTRNTNLAESITASNQFVAGIVGGTQWTSDAVSSKGSKNYGDEKLEVSYNTTYTADDKITGGCKADFIYDNTSGAHTYIHDNKKAAITTVGGAEDFQSAFAGIKDGDIIVLSAGDFDCKTVTWPKNGVAVTIKGNGEDSKLTNLGYVPTDNCDVTLEDLNLFVEKGGSSTSFGFQNANSVTLKNVKVMGEFHTFSAKNAVFEGCYFVHDGVNAADRQGLWCDGYGKTVVKDCIFEVIPPDQPGNETKAILIYSTTNTDMGDVEVTNCTFKKGLTSAKACVEIHSENFTKAGTVTITGCTWDAETYKGGLWREIYNVQDDNHNKGDETTFYTVYVDGQLDQEAKDGKN